MEVVPFVRCRAVGSVCVVGPDAIQSGVTRAAAACTQTTDIVVDELFPVGVAVVNRVEEEVSDGVALKRIVVRSARVKRYTLLVDNTESWTRSVAVGGPHGTVSDGVKRSILSRCGRG